MGRTQSEKLPSLLLLPAAALAHGLLAVLGASRSFVVFERNGGALSR